MHKPSNIIKIYFLFFSFLFSTNHDMHNEVGDSLTLTINEDTIDSVLFDSDSDIFELQMNEAKMILSESVISDITGDTLEAIYQFEILFESLAILDNLNETDEFQHPPGTQ